jgi:TetR/AcrR family transcriptional regulator, transcriptional repressor for nem operon
MVGRSQAEKARTHERIVAVASRQFREKGIDGIGVADLMKAAGTTAGGFYKHFESRDALVTEAMQAAFGTWDVRVQGGETSGRPVRLADLVDEYLCVEHRDNVGEGCPFAALATDLARSDPHTRAAATDQLAHNIELLGSLIDDKAAARRQAILVYAAMVGAVSLARLSSDDRLSREILDQVRSALTEVTNA